MIDEIADDRTRASRLPNGSGAAALMAAGLGALALAVLAIAADHSLVLKKMMTFYTPTGPLSGVSTTAIAIWLACWIGLDAVWKRREVPGWWVFVGLGGIAIGFVLMFPPVGDLF